LGQNHSVIAPLLPGWSSDSVAAEHSTADGLSYVLLDLLDALPQAVPVVASSVGAWIALEAAVKSCARISSLVLIAPLGVKLGGREDRDFLDLYANSWATLQAANYATPEHAPRVGELDEDGLLALAHAQLAVARIGWQPYLHNPVLPARLHRVTAPTLVIGGHGDGFVLADDYYATIAATIGAGARLEMLPAVGHRAEEDAPAAVARTVAQFLDPSRGG
jgi:pimeloyl-ACP methyl ester carboxylesterase